MKISIYPQAQTLDGSVLTPFCTFDSIFSGPKKPFPLSSVEHPVSEVAYSRSDYDGRKWWRTWFHSGGDKVGPLLSQEINHLIPKLM